MKSWHRESFLPLYASLFYVYATKHDIVGKLVDYTNVAR